MCLWLQSFKFNWLNEKRQPPFGRLRHVLGERTERRHGSSTQAIIRANLKRDPSAFDVCSVLQLMLLVAFQHSYKLSAYGL
jgi:hypothetical protein